MSLQRAARKLRSLLFIAQTGEKQTVQVSELVEDLLALVNYRLVLQKVTVKTNVPKNILVLRHPERVLGARPPLHPRQCARSDVRFAHRPSLTIVAEESAPHCCIHIVDNGRVRQELHDRVFEPFFTTKGPPHNGIGLYLAAEIVRHAGGKIQCLSPSPLGRTEFTVRLPIDQPGTQPA